MFEIVFRLELYALVPQKIEPIHSRRPLVQSSAGEALTMKYAIYAVVHFGSSTM